MKPLETLEIPGPVLVADDKAELARIWLADGNQVVALSPRLWQDPGAWGVMLVDLAKHVATAYASAGIPYSTALHRIRAAAEAEWTHATDDSPSD